jgi:hypothetical protein
MPIPGREGEVLRCLWLTFFQKGGPRSYQLFVARGESAPMPKITRDCGPIFFRDGVNLVSIKDTPWRRIRTPSLRWKFYVFVDSSWYVDRSIWYFVEMQLEDCTCKRLGHRVSQKGLWCSSHHSLLVCALAKAALDRSRHGKPLAESSAPTAENSNVFPPDPSFVEDLLIIWSRLCEF